jgi:hypothetical protein
MPDASSPEPSRRIFVGALLRGLGWGIAATTVVSATAALFLAPPGDQTFRQTLEVAAWTAMIASILAIFPVAPVAAILAWQLYSRGIATPLAYAAVGAFAAVLAPILVVFLLTETMRYQPNANYAVINEAVAQSILAGIALAGAFGGFMGGRALQRPQS